MHPRHAETGEMRLRRKGLFPCHHKCRYICQGTVGGDIAKRNAMILDVLFIKSIGAIKNQAVKPGHQFPFNETGGFCRFNLDLVLV